MATQVSEKEARQVAEDAREQDWKLPSFGKGLFMGDFRLDLIHPQPQLDAAKKEKGERFLGFPQRVTEKHRRFPVGEGILDEAQDARFDLVDARFKQIDLKFEQVATREQISDLRSEFRGGLIALISGLLTSQFLLGVLYLLTK